jgi:hypothetical protein
VFAEKLQLSTSVLSGQVLTVILGRPATDVLLLMGVFYLWVYVQHGRISALGPPAVHGGSEQERQGRIA